MTTHNISQTHKLPQTPIFGKLPQGRNADPMFSDTLRSFATFVRGSGFSMEDREMVAAKLDAAAEEIVAMLRRGYTSDFGGNRAELRRYARSLREGFVLSQSIANRIADAIDAVIGK